MEADPDSGGSGWRTVHSRRCHCPVAHGDGGVARGGRIWIVEALSKACEVDLDVAWQKLGAKKRKQVLYGLGNKRIRVRWGESWK